MSGRLLPLRPSSTPFTYTSDTPPPKSRMPTVFNIVRAVLYAAVIAFTIICLAMAGRFQSVLTMSDLTRFVPFALFVCSASLFIFLILLGSSIFLKERNPISTRIELACLGLTSIFWLVLGVFLATSESQDADVECFSGSTDSQQTSLLALDPEVASFTTEMYQAMYHVLQAFALLNAVIVIFCCLTLLFLAMRRHKAGDQHMWYAPVTHCSWFNLYAKGGKSGLKGSSAAAAAAAWYRNKSVSSKPAKNKTPYTEPVLPIARRHERQKSRQDREQREQMREIPSRQNTGPSRQNTGASHGASRGPSRQNTGGSRRAGMERVYPSMAADRPRRQDSGRSAQSSVSPPSTQDFNAGGMLNPARTGPPRR